MERTYRKRMQADDLVYFTVIHKQTDLYIGAEMNLKDICSDYIVRQRKILEDYIRLQPEFETSLVPIEPLENAPEIAIRMAEAAKQANVGPMAAVAGGFSQMLAEYMENRSGNLIIENGGDLYIKTSRIRTVSIYAGENKLRDKLKMMIRPEDSPVSICTSSGKFGHSFSFGKADAVTIVSQDAFLADAAATAVCNRVSSSEDIPAALEYALSIKHISGALVVADNKMGAYGKIELV